MRSSIHCKEERERGGGKWETKIIYLCVFPLFRYSMVFIFLGWNFLLHLPFLITALAYSYYAWSKEKREYFSARTEYVWLILYPFVLLIHGTLAGLICKLLHIMYSGKIWRFDSNSQNKNFAIIRMLNRTWPHIRQIKIRQSPKFSNSPKSSHSKFTRYTVMC